ncbi:MAG: DUF6722 family protein [Bacteroidota bacterium]|nr:DUF6722 family protein [Bacteroidota bacterium]
MKNDEFRKEVGKFFVDIAKLIFGGVVLATVLKIEIASKFIVISIGIIATLAIAILGFIIMKSNKRN